MGKESKLSKITMLRNKVFAGEVRLKGEVVDVDDTNQHRARAFVDKGDAVEGTVKLSREPAPNKQVQATDVETK
jgi:hypothetical protein